MSLEDIEVRVVLLCGEFLFFRPVVFHSALSELQTKARWVAGPVMPQLTKVLFPTSPLLVPLMLRLFEKHPQSLWFFDLFVPFI
jgi:hypothetical protein